MGIRGPIRFALGAVVAASLVAGGPTAAQTQPATAKPAAAKPAPDTANVTIFAPKKKPKSRAEERLTTIGGHDSARSCRFGTNIVDVLLDPVLLAAYNAEEEGSQNYYEDMGIENPLYGLDVSAENGGQIDDISPLAGKGPDSVTAGQGNAGGCSASDIMGAAARNDIARHDKSLKLGLDAFDAKDYPKAMAYFKEGYSKVGYAQAAFLIAKMYFDGLGTPRDTREAIVWYKRVAEAPYAAFDVLTFNPADPYYKNARIESQITLALIYLKGLDVPVSPKDARKWYAEAEKYGYVPAGFVLGQLTESGFGGPRDVTRAVAYYQKAGEYGFAPAQYRLGQLYYSGDDGVAQDKTRAGAWLLLASKAGHPDALYAVARMYELGEGGASVDVPRALFYYKEAAIRGQVDAQVTLATYLYTGEGGAPKNLESARKLFQAAAEQGNPEAMFNLGVMLTNGEGGPKDLVRAYAWFAIAEKGGVAQAGAAMRELGGKMTAEERAQAEALLDPKPAK